jgi:hypothetical protein
MRNVALAALLELLEQAAETAVEHRSGRGAAENSAERQSHLHARPHDRAPDDKLGITKEMLRVLRRGGTLHVADYDKPAVAGESRILSFAQYVSGRTSSEPHASGGWTAFLAKAGFAGVRRQASLSIGVGRLSVFKARKR